MKRGQLMSNYVNDLRTKITGWVLEELATYSEFRADDLLLHLKVTYGYDTDVGIEKARPNSILFYQAWVFDPDQQKAYSNLSKKERREFFYELEQGLTNFLVYVDIQPDTRETIEIIRFYRRLYPEEITKTSFFDALLMMNRAMNFTRIFIVNRLGLDIGAPESSEGKGVG